MQYIREDKTKKKRKIGEDYKKSERGSLPKSLSIGTLGLYSSGFIYIYLYIGFLALKEKN